MNNNDNFIKAYQNFELTVKNVGFDSVWNYEESLSESNKSKSEKIKMCRVIRNFILHESNTFVEATKEMLDFLAEETALLDEGQTPVKKKMIPLKYGIHDTDLITTALDFMLKKKLNVLPVLDNRNYTIGVFTFKDLAMLVASGDYNKSKKVSIITKKTKLNFIDENTPMAQFKTMINDSRENVFLVVNYDKKIVGWIS